MERASQPSGALTVVVFDTEPQTRNRYIAVAIARAFARHGSVERVLCPGYDDLVATCRQTPVDLLVALGGSGAFAGPLLRAAALSGVSVLWTGEDPYELTSNLELARHFAVTFSNDAAAASRYEGLARHLPFAASRDFHEIAGALAGAGEHSLFDLFFVGTAWPNRVDSLDSLLSRLPSGLRLKFGLSGNAALADWQLGSPDLLTDFRVAPREFARLARRSKLVLTLDRDFSAATEASSKGSSPPPRLFEIGLVGTPQVYLTSAPLDPRYYATGEEVAVTFDIGRAAAEITRLLADEPARIRMGERAAIRTRAEHLYEHRVETILHDPEVVRLLGRRAGARPVVPRTPAIRAGRSRRPRIMSVVHNLAGVPPYGGVELYQETLAAALPDYEFMSFAASDSRIAITVLDRARQSIECYPAQVLRDGTAFDPQRDAIFYDALVRHEIDLVHYQHLMHHSVGYPLVGAMLGLPQVATAHDFFLACSRFNLIGHEGRFCGIDTDRTVLCDLCLEVAQRLPEGAQSRRREIMREVIARLDRVLFNTPSSRDLMRRIYPALDPERATVVGMTGDPATLAALSRSAADRPAGRMDALAVAVIGNVSRPKGASDLLAIIWHLRDRPITFHLHGRVDPEFTAAVAALPNAVAHGPYLGADLAERLRGQRLSLHVSIWPETYCITLDEARAAGLVPIVLGIGALAERVRDRVDGYVVDIDRPSDLVTLLRRFAADPAELDRLAAGPSERARIDPVAIHRDHVAAMRSVYESALTAKPVLPTPRLRAFRRVPSYLDSALRFGSADWTSPDLDLDPTTPARGGVLIAAEAALAPVLPESCTPPAVGAVAELAGSRLDIDDLAFAVGSGRTARLGGRHDAVLALSGPPGTVAGLRAFGFGGADHWRLPVPAGPATAGGIARAQLTGLPSGRYDVLAELALAGSGTAWFDTGVDITLGDAVATERVRPSGDRSPPPSAVGAAVRRRRSWFAALFGRRMREARGHLDQFAGPHDPGTARELRRADLLPLRVGGWLVPRDGTAVFETIALRLVGRRWTARVATVVTERADVAVLLGAPHLSRSGFVSLVELGPLPPGRYRIDLVGVRPDGREAVLRAGQFTLV